MGSVRINQKTSFCLPYYYFSLCVVVFQFLKGREIVDSNIVLGPIPFEKQEVSNEL